MGNLERARLDELEKRIAAAGVHSRHIYADWVRLNRQRKEADQALKDLIEERENLIQGQLMFDVAPATVVPRRTVAAVA
jgi:hypothetical protein